jgi:hypothetical protein
VFYDIFATTYGFIYKGVPLPWEDGPWEDNNSNGFIIPIEDHPLYSNITHSLKNITTGVVPKLSFVNESTTVAMTTLNNLAATVTELLSSGTNSILEDIT